MASRTKQSNSSKALEPGAQTHEKDRLIDSTPGDKIRSRAYEIHLERGGEPGRDLEDWLQAERELTTDADQSSNRPLAGKAVTYKALGGPEVIEIVERTVRAPAAGEVRIEVRAAAVNHTDILLRDPGFGNLTSNIVPGMDAAGIIESVGPDVSRLHAGDKVMAAVMPLRPEGGAQAQHIVVPAASVVPIPEGASLAEASTLPMNGLTALNALDIAALKTGQILAVSGGAGLVAQ
jgi:NADPH-dependent curcumin reductase CurA